MVNKTMGKIKQSSPIELEKSKLCGHSFYASNFDSHLDIKVYNEAHLKRSVGTDLSGKYFEKNDPIITNRVASALSQSTLERYELESTLREAAKIEAREATEREAMRAEEMAMLAVIERKKWVESKVAAEADRRARIDLWKSNLLALPKKSHHDRRSKASLRSELDVSYTSNCVPESLRGGAVVVALNRANVNQSSSNCGPEAINGSSHFLVSGKENPSDIACDPYATASSSSAADEAVIAIPRRFSARREKIISASKLANSILSISERPIKASSQLAPVLLLPPHQAIIDKQSAFQCFPGILNDDVFF
jgi:hypothetical protein